MQAHGLDAVLVRATDAFLNEYVPEHESLRAYITGFTGSMGDALITQDRAILFIDGRYTLQAEQQAPSFERREIPLGTPIEQGWLDILPELAAQGVTTLGVETDRVPVATFDALRDAAAGAQVRLAPTLPSWVAVLKQEEPGAPPTAKSQIWPVDKSVSGHSVQERLAHIAPRFTKDQVDGYLVVPLDELAWVVNLRGDAFPYQATFRAQAVVLRDHILLAADAQWLAAGATPEPEVRMVGEGKLSEALEDVLRERGTLTLGYAPAATPESLRAALAARGVRLVSCESPFTKWRTYKTPEELAHMASAFARADQAVLQLQRWLSREVTQGNLVTEVDVAQQMKRLFLRSGAWGLSFQVISAAGKNGAVIHYSKPDGHTPITAGQMYLLDTGGYYEGGYATDLTRTFLVGTGALEASAEQKEWFTVVLQGAIAGMSARIPKGSTGEQLDAIVRDPIWRAGYTYAHGTGHGVGVNVHEFPPRVAPGVRWLLEAGQVFSIEPGLYLPGKGGVRIENLVTLVEDPDDDRFLRVKPLTFSPLDARLIDKKRLRPHERAFLRWFAQGFKAPDRLAYPLPPVA